MGSPTGLALLKTQCLWIGKSFLNGLLTHRKWYAVRNTGSWTSAQAFEVHYLVQMGDADNSSTVDFADLSFINTSIPTISPIPDALIRKDVSADDFITFTDLSVANGFIPSIPPVKPSGH